MGQERSDADVNAVRLPGRTGEQRRRLDEVAERDRTIADRNYASYSVSEGIDYIYIVFAAVHYLDVACGAYCYTSRSRYAGSFKLGLGIVLADQQIDDRYPLSPRLTLLNALRPDQSLLQVAWTEAMPLPVIDSNRDRALLQYSIAIGPVNRCQNCSMLC
jgi:hypothetical protein